MDDQSVERLSIAISFLRNHAALFNCARCAATKPSLTLTMLFQSIRDEADSKGPGVPLLIGLSQKPVSQNSRLSIQLRLTVTRRGLCEQDLEAEGKPRPGARQPSEGSRQMIIQPISLNSRLAKDSLFLHFSRRQDDLFVSRFRDDWTSWQTTDA